MMGQDLNICFCNTDLSCAFSAIEPRTRKGSTGSASSSGSGEKSFSKNSDKATKTT